MGQLLDPALRWTLLIDPAAALTVIERISKAELPRKICRPLDRRREERENAELARYDAEIEAAFDSEAASDLDSTPIEPVRYETSNATAA